MDPSVIYRLAVTLGLGLLVGLQRQRTTDEFAGVRTFTLITLLGFLSAHLAQDLGGWVVAASILGLAALIVIANRLKVESGDFDYGMTTEVAALLMFLVGALAGMGRTPEAVVSGGAIASLLHFKDPLHQLADRIDPDEFRAIMTLAIIGLVILPVLPDQSYGPYQVLNPFQIWLMVVLIVGISLGAYVAYRLFGERHGSIVGGILGGLISSTATAVSYAGRSKRDPGRSAGAAVVVVLASTVVFFRVLLEIAVVAPETLAGTAPPLLAMAAFMILVSGVLWWNARGNLGAEVDDHDPPSELKPAIVFGVLYAAVLFAVAAAREHFGTGALYMVAGISGLTDVDAITLSTAQLVKQGQLEADTGWRLILVGSMANLVFKGGAIALLGSRRLLARVAVAFGAALGVGGLLIWLWPT